MNHRYSPIQRVPLYEEEIRAEADTKNKNVHPPLPSIPMTYSSPTSPEQLADVFTTFINSHGRTTESALSCLTSGSPTFSRVHHILQYQLLRVAQHLAGSNDPALCVRLLTLAIASGHSPKPSAYEGVCWVLSKNKRYGVLLEVYQLAKANLGKLSRRLLDWRLRATFELENFAAIEKVLQDYESTGVKPSRRTWHIILIAHLRNRNIVAARQCLASMEQAGFPPNPTTHAAIAANYHYLGIDSQVKELAVSVLGSLPPSKAVFVVNQLLDSHLRFCDESGFYQLLSLFDNDAITPLQVLFESLVKPGDAVVPLTVSRSTLSLAPDAKTFLVAVRFCMGRSQFLAAEEVFPLMERRGFPLSPAILAAYLKLEFSMGRPDFAVFVASQLLMTTNLEDLFNQLCRRKPKPHWKWPYKASRIPPHVDIFNALLKGVLCGHGWDAARIVLQLMERVKIGPNTKTLKILIVHLIRHEQATPSIVLRTLRQLSPTFRPSISHLHPIINRILHSEKRRLYLPRRKDANKYGAGVRLGISSEGNHTSDGPTAGLQIGHFLGRPNLAGSLVDSMASRGIRSDSQMLALRIRYDAVISRETATATDTYSNGLTRGITPSNHHIAALMEGFARQGETDTALKIMRSAEEGELKPNLVMYTILLHGYGRQHQPKTAVRIFQAMISSGIQPDARAICVLCNAFILARRLDLTRKLLVTLWPYIQPFPHRYAKLRLIELLKIFRNLDSSVAAPRRDLDLESRTRLRRKLSQVIMEYKRASGLRGDLSSSPEVRRLARNSLHASRRI